MLETSAEVLIHLIKVFDHYEKNQSRLAQALIVRTRSEPSNPCQKANPGRRFTRHCVNSPFIGGFIPAAYSTHAHFDWPAQRSISDFLSGRRPARMAAQAS
jgi:hypothetical protein